MGLSRPSEIPSPALRVARVWEAAARTPRTKPLPRGERNIKSETGLGTWMRKMQPIYRITKWTETFETADSRRHRSLKWFSVSIGFSSNGYALMIGQFGDDAPAIYGAWIALVNIVAVCPVRGILSTSSGAGLTVDRLSLLSHFPSTVFGKLIEWPIACLDSITRIGFASSLLESFRGRKGTRKPARFIEAAISTHCSEHNISESDR